MSPEIKDRFLKALERWREASRELAGFVIFIGFFGTLFLLATYAIPAENKDVLLVLVGVLAGSYKDVVGFLWGGSYGSEKKTEHLVKPE